MSSIRHSVTSLCDSYFGAKWTRAGTSCSGSIAVTNSWIVPSWTDFHCQENFYSKNSWLVQKELKRNRGMAIRVLPFLTLGTWFVSVTLFNLYGLTYFMKKQHKVLHQVMWHIIGTLCRNVSIRLRSSGRVVGAKFRRIALFPYVFVLLNWSGHDSGTALAPPGKQWTLCLTASDAIVDFGYGWITVQNVGLKD